MNLDEPLREISATLAEAGARGLPIGSGRWYVLFGNRQRPLLMPRVDYELQKQCLGYFVGGRLKSFYARIMLRMNELFPAAGLLPELSLPARRSPVAADLPSSERAHAAIQIGTPGPYQKASALLVSGEGEAHALAKIALGARADRMVRAEAAWLRELAQVSELADQIPCLLAEGELGDGRAYLVISLAPSTRITTDFTAAHARFLKELGRVHPESMRFKASRCWTDLEGALEEIERHVTRREGALLEDALLDCRKLLADFRGPFVLGQGDFAWWNIRLHEQRNRQLRQSRIFVFDWEYARSCANPLGDVLHYHLISRVAAGKRVGRWFLGRILRSVGGFAREAFPEWRWRSCDVAALALAYMLDVLLGYYQASRGAAPMDDVMRGYWHLVNRRSAWLT